VVFGPGDVDGDGFADLVVGSQGGSTGKAYLFMGGASGITTTPIALQKSGTAGPSFPYVSVPSTPGDLNGDGYPDIVLGDSDGFGGGGGARVFNGTPNRSLLPVQATTIFSSLPGSNLGITVAVVGDLDGDGYDDLVVGEPGNYGADSQGSALLYPGSATSVSGGNSSVLADSATNGGWGVAAAGGGSITGSPYGTVLVASWTGDRVHIFTGSLVGLQTVVVLTGNPAGAFVQPQSLR